ncbi:MAG: acyl carrier protein [Bacteroidales bacterium]|nr:acyl carrier protein [Bacteroidales bacterium]
MEENKFLRNFIEVFDEVPTEAITMNTVLRAIEGWSSLVGLSIIAMADQEYGVEIDDVDLRGIKTVGELFDLIQKKTNVK